MDFNGANGKRLHFEFVYALQTSESMFKKKVLGSNPIAWILSGYSGFYSPKICMELGYANLRVNGCLYVWDRVATCLLTHGSWDRLKSLCNPDRQKEMEGWIKVLYRKMQDRLYSIKNTV